MSVQKFIAIHSILQNLLRSLINSVYNVCLIQKCKNTDMGNQVLEIFYVEQHPGAVIYIRVGVSLGYIGDFYLFLHMNSS